jgi:hypothetical protein
VPWNLRPREETVMRVVAGGIPTKCLMVCLIRSHEEIMVSGDGSYLLQQDLVVPDASQVFVGMPQEVSADKELDELPYVDVVWDDEPLDIETIVGEDWVHADQKQVPILASVMWDNAGQEGPDVAPFVDVA